MIARGSDHGRLAVVFRAVTKQFGVLVKSLEPQ